MMKEKSDADILRDSWHKQFDVVLAALNESYGMYKAAIQDDPRTEYSYIFTHVKVSMKALEALTSQWGRG